MSLKYLPMIFVCVSPFAVSLSLDFITRGCFGLILLMFLTDSYILWFSFYLSRRGYTKILTLNFLLVSFPDGFPSWFGFDRSLVEILSLHWSSWSGVWWSVKLILPTETQKSHFYVRPWSLLTILNFSKRGPTDTTVF